MQEKAPKLKLRSKIQNQGFAVGVKIEIPNFQNLIFASPPNSEAKLGGG